jgi:hypothetical protein
MGKERARQWRRERRSLPRNVDAEVIADFVQGSDAADRLGLRDEKLRDQILAAAGRFSALDYLSFDPSTEPPPSNVPEQCECGLWNERGRKSCRKCRKRLRMVSRYWVWYSALTRTSIGESYGVNLGSKYANVINWIPEMRPYRRMDGDTNGDFYDSVYAVTHVVYTLNNYNHYRESLHWGSRSSVWCPI